MHTPPPMPMVAVNLMMVNCVIDLTHIDISARLKKRKINISKKSIIVKTKIEIFYLDSRKLMFFT